MIAKIIKGAGFRGALNYVLQKSGAEVVGGNMSGETPRELASEFGAVRGHNTKCTKPVFHASLSLPTGESLSDGQWNEAAGDFLEKLGFQRGAHQCIVVRHTDTEHDHVHIIANRVNLESFKAADLKHDFRKSHEAVRGIEQKFRLQKVKSNIRESSRTVVQELARGGKADAMRAKFDLAIKASRGYLHRLHEHLKRSGVEIKLIQRRSGRIVGYTLVSNAENVVFKGSELGKCYSLSSVSQRLVCEKQSSAARVSTLAVGFKSEAGQRLAKLSGVDALRLNTEQKTARTVKNLSKLARKSGSKNRDHEL